MASLPTFGRYLVILGIVLVAAGAMLVLLGRLGVNRLPGDILVERRGVAIWLPLASSLVISVILTLVLNLLQRR
jgi:multisubunit Na+/H+ antiporter MnhG subunit